MLHSAHPGLKTGVGCCAEAAEPAPEIKLPKAVLQQLCQKQQWPPPKFERLAPGGHRMAHAGIRYSVMMSMPASSGPRKKKVRIAILPVHDIHQILIIMVYTKTYAGMANSVMGI